MHADAHHAEYLAAAAALHEQTPPPVQTHFAAGDYVNGITAGKRWSGRIEFFSDDGRICVNVNGEWLYVNAGDITH